MWIGPSIPPGQLPKARGLTTLYTARSERLFCEPLGHQLLRLWFLDRDFSEGSFNHSAFPTVDCDAISMLNVSATRELYRELKAQTAEVERLREEMDALKAPAAAQTARFDRLEQIVKRLSPPAAAGEAAATRGIRPVRRDGSPGPSHGLDFIPPSTH